MQLLIPFCPISVTDWDIAHLNQARAREKFFVKRAATKVVSQEKTTKQVIMDERCRSHHEHLKRGK